MKIKLILSSFLIVVFFNINSISAQTTMNDEVKSLVKKKIKYNKDNGYGFRIQLDNGFETTIKTTQSKFKIEFPEVKTYIIFESPEWKVQVGDFKTRLEADKAVNQFKRKFPSAIVVPR